MGVRSGARARGLLIRAMGAGILEALAEALDNVEKHSGATTVSIAVTVGRGGVRMTVSDHGKGFELSRAGRGVARMRAALAEAGGSLSVNSVPGEGTTVSGVVPRAR
ncbi:ATP-binding protein [Nonomuraea harbinensis]|uniref:ATP-binding protein n=1 Tax=Nonomuraea harbinensis TaxID=1286938 RepID=A0ABW1C9D8_9ACTN|nr:ATP-binding protein [Nonomuraea harbinensis]